MDTKKTFNKYMTKQNNIVQKLAKRRTAGIFIYILILMLLLLLNTAGYFHPFFALSINLIFLTSMILSVLLLGASSRTLFVISLIFWVLAGFFKVFHIDIWAERTAIYTFEALLIGVMLIFVEDLKKK